MRNNVIEFSIFGKDRSKCYSETAVKVVVLNGISGCDSLRMRKKIVNHEATISYNWRFNSAIENWNSDQL